MAKKLAQKRFKRYRESRVPMPDLIAPQVASFRTFLTDGLSTLFKEFSPIPDYSKKKFELEFTDFEIGEPKVDEYTAKENKMTYDAPLRVTVRLTNKQLGTKKDQPIFLADIPMMTDHGTFVINGVERIIVPQLARSFGVFFTTDEVKGKKVFGAKIIPARGAWIEIESDADGVLYVKIDRKRKFPATSLLRILGAKFDTDIISLMERTPGGKVAIQATLEKDPAKTVEQAYIEVYKRLRDGDLATPETARDYINSIFSPERYDLSYPGRHRFNQRFGLSMEETVLERRTLNLDDAVIILSHIVSLNNDPHAEADDIDHLGFRRVRQIGELIEARARIGLSRMKRNIQDRMSTIDVETTLPSAVVNPRPLSAAIKEFFTANSLSQLAKQQNILEELEELRTVSALGPGGLTRERAGFEVRDVHTSHYGRLCPIQTPEGANIGLILRMTAYAKINEFGIIETPYAVVKDGKVTDEIHYLNAFEEEDVPIAHAAVSVDENSVLTDEFVEARLHGEPVLISKEGVRYIDIATNQMFSIATSMIPFVENDDANRALMGSNMQKQATPCIVSEAPLVATGVEETAARDTGRLLYAKKAGEVIAVDARHIVVKPASGPVDEYKLQPFTMTNEFSSFYHRPAVSLGDKVKGGDLLADTSSTQGGQLALGQNIRVAFMSWAGANFEDAIIISERLVRESKFSTIHMEEFEVAVRDTKLGPETTTPDIPNVPEARLRNLDEEGVVRIGAEVRSGDILVGKVTPKGETQLSPEERLLRSIFGDKAKDVKDTSLRMDSGKKGRVIGVKVFSREHGDSLESGVIKKIFITVAQVRNVSVGDKLAGRHGNKGVISRVLPIEDMPYTKDGEPVDIILTPLGVPSRMNLGQILELHLGLAAHTLDYQAIVPPFASATEEEIKAELETAGFDASGTMKLFDGRTGDPFEHNVAVGYMYIFKLHHMVEDKIHMRSIGPYSLITQQPLGGKAQNGGQRFGEMEVWALLGYGAAHILREMLTIKSDDITGRSEAFAAIVDGRPIENSHTPASFSVLINHMRGLCLDVILGHEEGKEPSNTRAPRRARTRLSN
ncbi:DNA-directed RNA polymerase subunit beta [Candidatus Kaiserbacteria bacterium CG10_big_fil_rev_8_21_14_0_10_45_20]|uniref:DNA-directed RNA polymerase subunit beta n=1 Tax=Candidatus Kaiserbacteria bacterium CG10_big_fil_rev_8_21_14_0_10_45_20 TaxID=1974607 RepID=A0A2H0UGB2_9BACT|nr:MAG: DNA-directed RNA polymerase subunit beta [Candidatus Kaiserbacteria bacterium CG10_big_fil_rev_8_21_14_0_10_45_20]